MPADKIIISYFGKPRDAADRRILNNLVDDLEAYYLKSGPASGVSFGYASKSKPKKKRPLNSWQKFVKANAKKPRFRSMNNTARFKKLGIAYRKTAAYKRSKK